MRTSFFCVFHEQSSFASTRGTDFHHFTATDVRFSFREFSRIKKQIWEENFITFLSSLYGTSDWNMRVVIFGRCASLLKMLLLTIDAKKFEGQIKCVQL